MKLFAGCFIKGQNHKKAYIIKTIAAANASQVNTQIKPIVCQHKNGHFMLWGPQNGEILRVRVGQ
jgi:hypothetical protein